MGSIKIHAGDFKGKGEYSFGMLFLLPDNGAWNRESISPKQLMTVEIANEENVKKIGGTIGWGIAGAALLGPVGLLAGLLCGGRKKEVTFVAKFKDGRKMLATTDNKTYTKLLSATFNNTQNEIDATHDDIV